MNLGISYAMFLAVQKPNIQDKEETAVSGLSYHKYSNIVKQHLQIKYGWEWDEYSDLEVEELLVPEYKSETEYTQPSVVAKNIADLLGCSYKYKGK